MFWRRFPIFGYKPALVPLVALLTCALPFFSTCAWALGLGDIDVRSYLGQPLQARIELISRSPEELENISARLASADSFRMVGLDRLALSVPLAFTVHAEYPDAWVEVRSTDSVDNPILQFVVEVNFANGRLLRQYTVFLDPPTVAAPVPLPAITTRSKPGDTDRRPEPPAEPRPEAEPVASESPLAKPVPDLDTSPEPILEATPEVEQHEEPSDPLPGSEAAPEASGRDVPGATEEQPGSGPAEADSEPLEDRNALGEDELGPADVDSDVAETISAKTEQTVTAEEDVVDDSAAKSDAPAAETEAESVEETSADKPAPAEESEVETLEEPASAGVVENEPEQDVQPAQAPTRAGRPAYLVTQQELETYGPVRRGQTLWGIASEVSAGTGLSVNQAMLAIQRYNPEAFAKDNINLLKSGAILKLPPPSEAARMSAREAMLESMRQAEDYAGILAGRTPDSRPAPILADSRSSGVEEPGSVRVAPAEDEGRLELVPPVEDPGLNGTSGAAGRGEADLAKSDTEPETDAVLLSEEEQEVAAQESEYLSQRIQELQEELGGSEPAIEVQDKGLAEMEQRLRAQRTSEGSENEVAPASDSRARQESPDRGFPGFLSDYIPWLAVPLILAVGWVLWWLRRRAGSGDAELPESVSPVDSPTETARVIADEAADILRTLDSDPEEDTHETGDQEHMDEVERTAPVIDLEDYIGHIEREPSVGGGSDTKAGGATDEPGSEPSFSAGESGEDPSDEDEQPAEPPVEPERPAPSEELTGETVTEPALGENAMESSEDTEADDPETKLDLARAYISMGDADAARELLQEVIRDGNEAQMAEASAMMDEI